MENEVDGIDREVVIKLMEIITAVGDMSCDCEECRATEPVRKELLRLALAPAPAEAALLFRVALGGDMIRPAVA